MDVTVSTTGYQLEAAVPGPGEHGHRMGCLDALKPGLARKPDDGYTVCLVVDTSDPRLRLGSVPARIPILFRFDCEWGRDPLVYWLSPDGRLTILREPWGQILPAALRFKPPWWPPRGDFDARLVEIPQRLHDLAQKWPRCWYEAEQHLPWEDIEHVNDIVFFGKPYHQIGGLPFWVQDPLAPQCPTCKEPMPFLLSLGSDNRLGWMFGDCGRLYAFYCARCCIVVSQAQCT